MGRQSIARFNGSPVVVSLLLFIAIDLIQVNGRITHSIPPTGYQNGVTDKS
jgi:hypothetical protein